MSKEEILESNKLIAEFMGSKSVYTDHSEYNEDGSMKYDHNVDGTPWIIETWTKPNWFSSDHLRYFGWSSYNMIENMLYHLSWSWIMPVVEKIDEMNFTCEILFIPKTGHKTSFFSAGAPVNDFKIRKSRIDSVYIATIEFIKWYNQNKLNETN